MTDNAKSESETVANSVTATEVKSLMDKTVYGKSLVIMLVLWFFLGWFGAHRFYMGKTSSAVAMLVLTIVGYATVVMLVGFVILFGIFVWWIVDLVTILRDVGAADPKSEPASAES